MGRVVIHPTDPDVVFATVLGSMWQDDPQKNAVRGLYKTTDGGSTWRQHGSAQGILKPKAGSGHAAQSSEHTDRVQGACVSLPLPNHARVSAGAMMSPLPG
jgi:hypothetical protein